MNIEEFKHSIKAYFKSRNKNINKLLDYAEKLGIKENVKMYVEVCDE